MAASSNLSAAASPSSQRTLPDFFIVGHPKCGTTALYEMLRRHPQIYMPVKEPWFFAPDRLPLTAAGYPTTLEDYAALFADSRPEDIVGEASPVYLMSRLAASAIAEVKPDARIIAILREPASFLRSLHLQSVQDHVETEKDLRKAIALESARRQGKEIPRHTARPQELLYSEHVRYVEQLQRYHAVFAPEQVLVLVYDDFRADNEATIRRVLRFLEVDDTVPVELIEANPSVRVRSPRLHESVRSVYLGRGSAYRAIKAAVKALTPRRLRHDVLGALRRRAFYGQPRPADEALMRELRARFIDEVVGLSEYLGRDLVTLWGYDDVG
ncbi:MAG: sulfotransferase family protein [Solirubrobacterales bacterium]